MVPLKVKDLLGFQVKEWPFPVPGMSNSDYR